MKSDDRSVRLAGRSTSGWRWRLLAALVAAIVVACTGGVDTLAPPVSDDDCAVGEMACRAQCVDVTASHAHCGDCDAACAEEEVCDDGTCVVGCGPGASACAGACTNLLVDPEHCGGCDSPCDEGMVCSEGACSLSCTGETTACGELCVNLVSDEDHCGDCGQSCGLGELCVEGTCTLACGPETVGCDDECADLAVDSEHCGACGVVCAPGLSCVAGSCELSCGPGTTDCGGSCADLAVDEANCGACGNACTVDEKCEGGVCVMSCGQGTIDCGGSCVDPQLDKSNCGGCGSVCDPGLVCSGGQCQLECTGGTTKCGGACINPTNDLDHCGACGNACGAGQTCQGGTCAYCLAGQTYCSGDCVDTSSDTSHCGGCQQGCPYPSLGTANCVSGTCDVQCNPNWGDCDNNGTCTDYLKYDEANCGGCGNVCGGDEICSQGACTPCPEGEVVCGNSCRDLDTDRFHCGACGQYCGVVPSGTGACVNGVCGFSCYSGYVDCDGNAANGCEVHVTSDPNNCGTCGISCASGEHCSGGACASCSSGETYCGTSCVNLMSNTSHCGACNVGCVTFAPHASGSCENGSCTLECKQDYLDCDDDPLNGCESWKHSSLSCGGCGVQCGSTEFCGAGACLACAPTDLGSTVPQSITGSTVGESNKFDLVCSNGPGPDVYFSFTAPSAGSYTFDTIGSSFNTVLGVRTDCDGASLTCDSNSGGNGTSATTVSLAAGQTVVIVLDGYYNSQGSYVLNIQ